MPDTENYNLSVSRFVPELRFGCVQIENSDRYPLEWATFVSRPGKVSLVLIGATGKPGSSDSRVTIDGPSVSQR